MEHSNNNYLFPHKKSFNKFQKEEIVQKIVYSLNRIKLDMDNKSEIEKKNTAHENEKTRRQHQQNSSSNNSWVKRNSNCNFTWDTTKVIIISLTDNSKFPY